MMPQTAMPSRIQDPSSPENGDYGPIRLHNPSSRTMTMTEVPAPTGAAIRPFAYLRYRWVTVLFLGGFLASVLAFTAWSVIPSKYSTYSLVRVYSSDPVLHSTENAQGRNDFAIYLKSQVAMIKSNFVLTAALRNPNVAALPMLRDQPDPVRFLEEELKVEFQEGSEILKILLNGDDPRAISQIVNSIQEAYFHEVVDEEIIRKKNRLKQLEDSINRMQDEVKRRHEQLKQSDVGNMVSEAIPGLGANLAANQLIRFKEVLSKIENDIANWENEKASLEKKLANVADETTPLSADYFEKLESDPQVQVQKKKIEDLQAKIAYLSKLSNDPNLASIVELKKKITEAQEKLDSQKKERSAEHLKAQMPIVEKKLKSDLERAKSNLVQLAAQKEKTEEAIEEFQKTLSQSGANGDLPLDFQRVDVRERAKIITEMLDKANLLRLEVNAPPRVSDFQRAAVPMKKDMKKQLLGTIAAALFGFGLVGMGVVVYESRVRRALSLADVQKSLFGPVAGVWPARDAAQGNEVIGETVEKTRAYLLQHFVRPGGKVIAVTSSLTEEGKGFVAGQLARSFARAGSKTLLIDFDLRAPSLHRWLNVENQRGVCDVVTGQVDFREVLLPQADGLMFLPAGNWTPDVRLGLAADRLDAFMLWLRQQFDIVVLDTHPLLAVAESLQLCRNADGILLSIERNETRLPLATRSHEKLATLASDAFGLVYQGATTEECLN